MQQYDGLRVVVIGPGPSDDAPGVYMYADTGRPFEGDPATLTLSPVLPPNAPVPAMIRFRISRLRDGQEVTADRIPGQPGKHAFTRVGQWVAVPAPDPIRPDRVWGIESLHAGNASGGYGGCETLTIPAKDGADACLRAQRIYEAIASICR